MKENTLNCLTLANFNVRSICCCTHIEMIFQFLPGIHQHSRVFTNWDRLTVSASVMILPCKWLISWIFSTYTIFFIWPKRKKKLNGVKSGLCGSQESGPELPIHLPRKRFSRALCTKLYYCHEARLHLFACEPTLYSLWIK